jgi:hypothetical protein
LDRRTASSYTLAVVAQLVTVRATHIAFGYLGPYYFRRSAHGHSDVEKFSATNVVKFHHWTR